MTQWQLRQCKGFSLIELVAVMLLVGILSAVVIPRMASVSVYDTRGVRDDSISFLRFSQKIAIAQRRWVQVSGTGTGLQAHYCSGSLCSTSLGTCVLAVADPISGQPYQVVPPSNVTVSQPAAFYFDCEGRPVDAAGSSIPTLAVTVSSSDGQSTGLTLEAETGYAHP
jgi:MSHA pilin protein MshC